MKKRSKRTLTRLLDREVSRVVRLHGACAKCGKVGNLHAAHIFSRKNRSVRWDTDNILPLCYSCHFFWAHKEPILFNDFVASWLGEHKFLQLKMKANSIKKWTVEEMEELLQSLRGIK